MFLRKKSFEEKLKKNLFPFKFFDIQRSELIKNIRIKNI